MLAPHFPSKREIAKCWWREIVSPKVGWERKELRNNPSFLSKRICWEGKERAKQNKFSVWADVI